MMILTATGVLDEVGPRTYVLNSVSQTLLDPGWANGLKHLCVRFPPLIRASLD